MRPVSEDFPQVLNTQEKPFCTDANVKAARDSRPMKMKYPTLLRYVAWPIFTVSHISVMDEFCEHGKRSFNKYDFKGFQFGLRDSVTIQNGSLVYGWMPTFDSGWLDCVRETTDTDAYISQFNAPTYQMGIDYLESTGIKYEVDCRFEMVFP